MKQLATPHKKLIVRKMQKQTKNTLKKLTAKESLMVGFTYCDKSQVVLGKIIKPLQLFVVACLFTVSIGSFIMPKMLIQFILYIL